MHRYAWSLLIAFILYLTAAARAVVPLEELTNRSDLWTLSAASFEDAGAVQGFTWTSNAQDSARTARPQLGFYGLPAVEAIARFNGGKLAQLTVLLYARGDAGELSRDDFTRVVQEAIARLTAETKVKFEARGKDASNAVKAEGVVWNTPAARYTLEYSFTKEVKTRNIPFRAEFIRLQIEPPARATSLLAGGNNAAAAKRFVPAEHVLRNAETGDVMLRDVPMVDQGEKGYCAVACLERVMRYYGLAVDANELAQVANSDPEGGTSARVLFAAVKKLGSRLRVKVRTVEEWDGRDFLAFINDYNRAAKKGNRAAPLPDPETTLNAGDFYAAMNPELFRELRTKNPANASRFLRQVQAQIDSGYPYTWSVILGMVPEPGLKQTTAGHMRLIIGYNLKSREILYSDSWGPGHELKRMPFADAWAITKGLNSIEPL